MSWEQPGTIRFVTSPNGFVGIDHEDYLQPGEYEVEPLKIEVDIAFEEPYTDIPLAWLSHTGYSGDNPNNPASYNYQYIHEDCVSHTHLKLRTYFYLIEDYGWVPYSPFVAMSAGHSRVGIKLPTAPTGLWGVYFPPDHGGPKVELQWNRNPPNEGVDKYWLERAIEEGEFIVVKKGVPDPGSGSKVYYTDYKWIPPGTEYVRYKVRAHNDEGWGPFCEPIEVELDGGPLMAGGAESLPTDLTLETNYPNPFNPSTQFKFGLPTSSHIRLQIMNIRGQIVRILVDEEKPAGWYTVTWDSKNESGNDVASGIYLYVLESEGKRLLKKMTLIR